MKAPNISEVVVFGPDEGFWKSKACGARITGLTRKDMTKIKDLVVRTEFESIFAPMTEHLGATGRLMESPEVGIVGPDARVLQRSLWTNSLGVDHYRGQTWRLYFWALLYDILDKTGIADGAHVKVYTALGLPHIHMGYAAELKAGLKCNTPQLVSRRGQKHFWVTISDELFGDGSTALDVKSQPFWIGVSQVFQWTDKGLMPDVMLLQDGALVLDFGSLTLNIALLVNSMIPVIDDSIPIGSWDIVKDCLAPRIDAARQKHGIHTGNSRWQECMPVYETGELRVGHHEPISFHEVLESYVTTKAEQRLKEVEAKIQGASDIGTVILAGGDVARNIETFRAKYAQNIKGDFRIAVGFDGQPAPKIAQCNGLLIGAILAWYKSQGV